MPSAKVRKAITSDLLVCHLILWALHRARHTFFFFFFLSPWCSLSLVPKSL